MPSKKTTHVDISSMFFLPTAGKTKTSKIRLDVEKDGLGIVVCSGKDFKIQGAWSISKSELEAISGMESELAQVTNFASIRAITRKHDNLQYFRDHLEKIPKSRLYLLGNACLILGQKELGKFYHEISPLVLNDTNTVTFETQTGAFRVSRK